MQTVLGSPYRLILSEPAGAPSEAIAKRLQGMIQDQSALSRRRTAGRDFAEQLFDSLASFKIKTASVAMHLGPEERTRFFGKLDLLMDGEEWEDSDPLPTLATFSTLLRLLLTLRPRVGPSIGLTYDGHLVAAWQVGPNRLTIECLPNDGIKWAVVKVAGEELETAAGATKLEHLRRVVEPYDLSTWISSAQ